MTPPFARALPFLRVMREGGAVKPQIPARSFRTNLPSLGTISPSRSLPVERDWADVNIGRVE